MMEEAAVKSETMLLEKLIAAYITQTKDQQLVIPSVAFANVPENVELCMLLGDEHNFVLKIKSK
jgi:hypothetical protein